MNYSEPLLTISDVMNLLDNRGLSYGMMISKRQRIRFET